MHMHKYMGAHHCLQPGTTCAIHAVLHLVEKYTSTCIFSMGLEMMWEFDTA